MAELAQKISRRHACRTGAYDRNPLAGVGARRRTKDGWIFSIQVRRVAVQPADGETHGTMSGIPLPAEAEDAIVAGALAEFYGLPGRGQNLSASQAQNRAYLNHIGNLRSLNRVGTSGANHGYTSPFHFNLRG